MQNNILAQKGFTLLEVVFAVLLLGTAAVIAATVTTGSYMRIEQAMSSQNDMLAVSSCLERVKAESFTAGGPARLLAHPLSCPGVDKVLVQTGTLRRNTEQPGLLEPYVQAGGELLLITITAGEASARYVVSVTNG